MDNLLKLIEFLLAQNRRTIVPDMTGRKNYNQTVGNPPVALESDGWLRSQFPYETGEGLPGGMYNDDGQQRTLESLMRGSPRYGNLMGAYDRTSRELLDNLTLPPTGSDLNAIIMDQINRNAVDRLYKAKRGL